MTLTWPSFFAALTNAVIPPPAWATSPSPSSPSWWLRRATVTNETPCQHGAHSPAASATFNFFFDTRRPPKGECTGLVTRDESKLRELASVTLREQQM